MRTKILAGVAIILAVVVASLYLAIGSVEPLKISADEATSAPAQEQEKSLLQIDDGVAQVNEGQDIDVNISLDFKAWAASKGLKVTQEEILKKASEVLGITLGNYSGDVYLQAYLGGGKKNGQWYLKQPTFSWNIGGLLSRKDLLSTSLSFSAKVPEGVALDNNELISSAFLFKRECREENRFLFPTRKCKLVKIAEAYDKDVINYQNPLADVAVTAFNTGRTVLSPSSRSIGYSDTSGKVYYVNNGKNAAYDVNLKAYLPKEALKFSDIPSGATLTEETIGNENYAVAVWNIGNLDRGQSGKVVFNMKGIQPQVPFITTMPFVEISTSTNDPNLTNNKKSINMVIVSSDRLLKR